MTRVAGIDCGTNSIRLLIADVERPGGRPALRDVTRQMRIVRLGQGVDRTGMLDPRAVERTLAAVREYAGAIREAGATRVRFVATSAMRDARNGDAFRAAVREILRVEPEVVPGTVEAALSFTGASSAVSPAERRPLLVVDIGGGSTELVLGDRRVEQAISLNVGAVRVKEKFFPGEWDPAREREATAFIDREIDLARGRVDLSWVGTLVGVAGTVTTVTAQALGLDRYRPERIHGAVLDFDATRRACRFLIEQPIAAKRALGFMPAGREDVIGPGALIWLRVIARVALRTGQAGHAVDHTVTSEHDILDGIALSLAE